MNLYMPKTKGFAIVVVGMLLYFGQIYVSGQSPTPTPQAISQPSWDETILITTERTEDWKLWFHYIFIQDDVVQHYATVASDCRPMVTPGVGNCGPPVIIPKPTGIYKVWRAMEWTDGTRSLYAPPAEPLGTETADHFWYIGTLGAWYDTCPADPPTSTPYVQPTYTPNPTYTPLPEPTCRPTITPNPTYTPLPTYTPAPTSIPYPIQP